MNSGELELRSRGSIQRLAEANRSFDRDVIEIVCGEPERGTKQVNWAKEIAFFALAAVVVYAFIWGVLAL